MSLRHWRSVTCGSGGLFRGRRLRFGMVGREWEYFVSVKGLLLDVML